MGDSIKWKHIFTLLNFMFSVQVCDLLIYIHIICFTDDTYFIEVTLSIFSGLPDPSFTVLNTNPNFTSILAAVGHHESTQPPSLLGYRGFQVRIITHRGGRLCFGLILEFLASTRRVLNFFE